MKNIILFDDDHWNALLPLCYTKPVAELRVGILTIREKWEKHLKGKASYITQDYLSTKYPINIEQANLVINSRYLPNKKIVRLIQQLENNEALIHNDNLLAANLNESQFEKLVNGTHIEELQGMEMDKAIDASDFIQRPYDIFRLNPQEIRKDYDLLTTERKSEDIPQNNFVQNPNQIFIEPGASVNFAYLNAESGPIYIGKDAAVMEGSMIRGPFAMGENAQIKMGAKIYEGTTVGPWCKVGGEVSNVVFQSYSNKGHDGYLGNSVIGEWCNIGADSNSSNLKNNYAEVKIWDYTDKRFNPTGLQFCGLIMGDHSKCGINTMFNTGTVIGVHCNIFGSGFPRNFIPSYSWGGAKGYKTYQLDKAIEVAGLVMQRRNMQLEEADQLIFEHIFKSSAQFRQWEA